MNVRRTLILSGCVLFLFMPRCVCGQSPAATSPTGENPVSAADDVGVGRLAPDFKLSDVGERSISLSDYRADGKSESEGRNVVLVFVRAHW